MKKCKLLCNKLFQKHFPWKKIYNIARIILCIQFGQASKVCYEKLQFFQSSQILCDPMNYTVHGILQARILEWVILPIIPGIFPTQDSNPGLQLCRQILYSLSHRGSPIGTLLFLSPALPQQPT